MKKNINSWGVYQDYLSDIKFPNSVDDLKNIITNNSKFSSYGIGKSYGDVCLNNEGCLISINNLSKIIDLNVSEGIVNCQAGIILKNLQDYVIEHGWMLPVVPGSQYISIGGAIANDVHGKNHLIEGSFGNHILELNLIRSDGQITNCSLSKNVDLFLATLGGIGLTGIILSVKIKLKPIRKKKY